MKKILILISFLLIGILFFAYQSNHYIPKKVETSYQKGIFIATVYNIDFPKHPGQSSEEQQEQLLKIISNVKDLGLNTIYFQVVPCCDALYNSKILPTSAFLSGEMGKANDKNFDPLLYLTTEAKKQNIDVYAWINPYRIKSGTVETPVKNTDFLSANHPAKKNPSLLITHYNGSMYLDPGNPDTRNLIVDVATELCKNYNIAGIIFDDYFYPKKYLTKENGQSVFKDFPDQATYLKYGDKNMSIEDWRRQNVTTLIKEIKTSINKIGLSQKFGISPFGIWANKQQNSKGSDTQGGTSSYYDNYADTLLWVKNSYIDFIMPQIYWNIGYDIADFSKLLSWWENAVTGTNVKLYIAHAAYKLGDENQPKAWQDENEIKNQILLTKKNSIVTGNVFYGYSTLVQNKLGISDIIREAFLKG